MPHRDRAQRRLARKVAKQAPLAQTPPHADVLGKYRRHVLVETDVLQLGQRLQLGVQPGRHAHRETATVPARLWNRKPSLSRIGKPPLDGFLHARHGFLRRIPCGAAPGEVRHRGGVLHNSVILQPFQQDGITKSITGHDWHLRSFVFRRQELGPFQFSYQVTDIRRPHCRRPPMWPHHLNRVRMRWMGKRVVRPLHRPCETKVLGEGQHLIESDLMRTGAHLGDQFLPLAHAHRPPPQLCHNTTYGATQPGRRALSSSPCGFAKRPVGSSGAITFGGWSILQLSVSPKVPSLMPRHVSKMRPGGGASASAVRWSCNKVERSFRRRKSSALCFRRPCPERKPDVGHPDSCFLYLNQDGRQVVGARRSAGELQAELPSARKSSRCWLVDDRLAVAVADASDAH